jgi:hypothetical protein
MRLALGVGIRLVLVVSVLAAAIALPLVVSYRSRCRVAGQIEAHWAFTLPGHERRRPHCGRPEQGLHYVLRKVGVS